MKKTIAIFVLKCSVLCSAAGTFGFAVPHDKHKEQVDSIKNVAVEGKTKHIKMSHSAYPVQIQIVGNAVRVDSPENQILPIYTQNGTFYLIMRLNKGINWLNGLPKGRYFINNRIVVIK